MDVWPVEPKELFHLVRFLSLQDEVRAAQELHDDGPGAVSVLGKPGLVVAILVGGDPLGVGTALEGLLAPLELRLGHVAHLEVDHVSAISGHTDILRANALIDHIHVLETFEGQEEPEDDRRGDGSYLASSTND